MKDAWAADPFDILFPASSIFPTIDSSRRLRRYEIILESLMISFPVREALVGVPSLEISCLMIQSPIS